jgi:hypothetical protein
MKKWLLVLFIAILLLGSVACASPGEPPSHIGNIEEGVSSGSGVKVATSTPAPVVLPQPTITVNLPRSEDNEYYGDTSVPAERMVIYSAYMTLVVEDVSATIAQIDSLATSFGGYVVNSNVSGEQDRLLGSISFRVDATRFNEALQALRDLAADVRSESTSGEDVTEEYVDLEARLRNLEASEAQLLELMKQAGTVEEILKVQQVLVDTREKIEQTKGRMQYLEESSALAYISVSLEQSKLAVDFTATSRTVKEGEKIRFDPEVSGGFEPYSYAWDFGDGETSTDSNPIRSYKSDGTYTVTLTVTDDRGNMELSTRTDYVTVLPGWSAGDIASGAWHGLVGFGHVLLNILIWLGIFSPLWIAILIILYFTWWRKRKPKAQ